jgi:hypothetical protein
MSRSWPRRWPRSPRPVGKRPPTNVAASLLNDARTPRDRRPHRRRRPRVWGNIPRSGRSHLRARGAPSTELREARPRPPSPMRHGQRQLDGVPFGWRWRAASYWSLARWCFATAVERKRPQTPCPQPAKARANLRLRTLRVRALRLKCPSLPRKALRRRAAMLLRTKLSCRVPVSPLRRFRVRLRQSARRANRPRRTYHSLPSTHLLSESEPALAPHASKSVDPALLIVILLLS